MISPGYSDYYHRTIEQHRTGLKLVPGGTGLGKTSGIPDLIQSSAYQQHKFIYCANRKQLIEEMAQLLDRPGSPPCYVILPRDLEAVLSTLKEHRQAFYELFEDSLFTDNVRHWNEKTPLKRIDLAAVKRACRTLEELIAEHITLPKVLEEQMDMYAHMILEAFKAALLGANNKRGNSPAYQRLADHPVIQSLFPCIAFKRRPEIRLMAVTLQKAFYGFFDGRKTLNLTRLEDEDGGYVLFLDEFDFLENDLVGLICRAPQISNPFRVVELFYRAMTRHKLPLQTYPLSNSIRNRIEEIKGIVDRLQQEDHLHFPDINQFTSTLPQKPVRGARHQAVRAKTSPAIFRTQHTISTDSLYLCETNRAFEIASDPGPANAAPYSALRLFDAVSQACEQILLLFKELERGDDEIIYRELLRHCFQDTTFAEELAHISLFSRSRRQEHPTQLSALLETGYSLYDIHDLQQRTDQEEVEVRHYSMHLTPERILCSLAQHNLVFGLSATADIPRHVHHFNLDWLHQQVNSIPLDEADRALIRTLNRSKAAKRANRIKIALLESFDGSDDYQRKLDQFLSAVATDEDFGDDTREGHLKRRVQLFFAALLWLCAHSAGPSSTSLLFLNTFKQVKLIFERYGSSSEGLFEIIRHEGNAWFEVYEIALQGCQFIIVFYNAQVGNTIRQSQRAQQDFDELFWKGKPVVVVTQYLSAGNGVNLQYWSTPDKTKRQDFIHIGLLETPYFYFGKPESDLTWEEKIALLKENIWYQAKLYTGKVITEQRFLQVLSTLNDPWEWNRRYQNDVSTRVDALFNHMSTFMQALGRVERIWERMPDQTVLLSREVYGHFQRFCSPEFEQLRQERELTISNNLQQVLAQVCTDLPQLEHAVRRSKDARLAARDEQCRQAIQQLLSRLEGLRRGNGDRKARDQWQSLRQAALKHRFRDELLHDYACVSESPYYRSGLLYLTPQNEIVPAHLAQPDTYHWRMDALYAVIRENTVIRDHFLAHDYKLAFSPSDQHFFAPYCYQAILAGAIGEEAITALLQDEGIELEETPDALFEVADLKIRGLPWYIDSKNYNERTLERFSAPPDDLAWHPKLNEAYFADSARLKVERLRAYHGTSSKLIYLNLVSSQPRPRGYYNDDFRQVSFDQASIIVIQGALQHRAPNAYHQAFEYFLHDLRSALLPSID
jgi:hypothetical protein